jgi:hypothetical protein
MISAVNSGSAGWQGGMYVPSGRPTTVGGQGFGIPGTAASTPPGVPNSGIIEARNNRGSNIRIPYARPHRTPLPPHTHTRVWCYG